jgi:predicted nucleic acid-binding protein
MQAGENCNVSSIAWAEFLCGPLDPPAEAIARHVFPQPEPFLPADAALAARLFNLTGRRSRSLADCMIASVAIRCGAKLATSNTADFQPFLPHGLVLA